MPDYYEILEIPRNASQKEIKAAFKRLALKYHPDRNPQNPFAEEHFKKINEAYQVLSDSSRKTLYDYGVTPQFYPSNPEPHPFTQYYRQSSEPYKNSYDPANYVSKSLQKKIMIATVILFLAMIGAGAFLNFFMNKQTAWRHYQDAVIFSSQGEIKAALVKIGYALHYHPDLKEAYILRAKINSETYHNYQRAIEDYDWILKQEKKANAEILFKRGFCYFKLYQFDSAIEDFDHAISIGKPKGKYYYYRAIIKMKLSQNSETVCADYKKAKELGFEENYESLGYYKNHCQ